MKLSNSRMWTLSVYLMPKNINSCSPYFLLIFKLYLKSLKNTKLCSRWESNINGLCIHHFCMNAKAMWLLNIFIVFYRVLVSLTSHVLYSFNLDCRNWACIICIFEMYNVKMLQTSKIDAWILYPELYSSWSIFVLKLFCTVSNTDVPHEFIDNARFFAMKVNIVLQVVNVKVNIVPLVVYCIDCHL